MTEQSRPDADAQPVEPDADAPAPEGTPAPAKPPAFSDAFVKFIPQGWAPYPSELPEPLPAARHTGPRRAAAGVPIAGERLIVPAGVLRTRSNDTDSGSSACVGSGGDCWWVASYSSAASSSAGWASWRAAIGRTPGMPA